jgi:REP element-mobilizing transposase RayT
MPTTRIRSRGRLPHWESVCGIYFVTFRLAGSLPPSVVASLQSKLAGKAEGARKKSRETERYLDVGAGVCHLKRPEVADLVANTLRRFDGEKYRLFAWCLMPNHVHVVVQPIASFRLAEILHSWKSYSGQMANRMLRRTGAFWQREYYDHLIRDGDELGKAIRYTAENPVKARLVDWPWVYVAKDWS